MNNYNSGGWDGPGYGQMGQQSNFQQYPSNPPSIGGGRSGNYGGNYEVGQKFPDAEGRGVWECLREADSGRIYFANEFLRQTQWHPPNGNPDERFGNEDRGGINAGALLAAYNALIQNAQPPPQPFQQQNSWDMQSMQDQRMPRGHQFGGNDDGRGREYDDRGPPGGFGGGDYGRPRGFGGRDNFGGGGRDSFGGGGRDNYGGREDRGSFGGRDDFGSRGNFGGPRGTFGGGRDDFGGRGHYGGRDNFGGRDGFGGREDFGRRGGRGGFGGGRNGYGGRDDDDPRAMNPFVLNKRLTDGQTVEDIVEVCRRHHELFDHVNVSTAMHRLAKVNSFQRARAPKHIFSDVVRTLQLHAVRLETSFKPQNISNIMWALATLGLDPLPELAEALSRRAVATAADFTPQNIANLLWALATLEMEPSPALTAELSKRALVTSGDFKPQDVANVVWSFARTGAELSAALAAAMAARAVATVAEFTPQAVANLLWAYARSVKGRLGQV